MAGLGDCTAEPFVRTMHKKLISTEEGRRLLREKPLITESSIRLEELSELSEGSLGREYAKFMNSHHFSPDERSAVRFFTDPDLAYIMTRYRQVHDFWHVLSGLPISILGEVSLKWFEWSLTGLPVCLFSGVLAPLKLPAHEQKALLSEHLPWAIRNAQQCSCLLSFRYEDNMNVPVNEVRRVLRFEPAPKI